jgi:hypothetical protein
MLRSPLGERRGEGAMQETIFGLTPSPNLSSKGERNMRREEHEGRNIDLTPPIASDA